MQLTCAQVDEVSAILNNLRSLRHPELDLARTSAHVLDAFDLQEIRNALGFARARVQDLERLEEIAAGTP